MLHTCSYWETFILIYQYSYLNKILGIISPLVPLGAPVITIRGHLDENQQAFKDPLHVPVRPITKASSKKIKEALNGLIQEIWADSNAGHSKLGPKEDEGVINLIQAIEG